MERKKSLVSSLVFLNLLSFLVILYLIELPHVASFVDSNTHCDSQDDCGDFMMCLDNECVCDDYDTGGSSSAYSEGRESSSDSAEPCGREKCDNRTNICRVNSYCSTDGVCKCSDGFEEEKHSRKCKLPYGSQCASTEACNTDKFLSCIQGTCRCHNEEDTEFDSVKQTCVGGLSKSCELHAWMGLQLGCGHNAECFKVSPDSQVNPHEGYGVCHCSSGFLPNKSQGAYPHSCEASYGRKCTSSRDCGDYANLNLICLRNRCSCRPGSFYDEEANECRLLVGSKCSDKDGRNTSCVDNAECKYKYLDSGSVGESVCTCADGFIQNSRSFCIPTLSHNDSCTNNNSSMISCNSNAGLVCKGGWCGCKDNFEFDFETVSCKASSCNLNNSEGNSSCPSSNSKCNPDSLVCQCVPGFVQDTDTGRCTQLLGKECSVSVNTTESVVCDQSGQSSLGLTCLRRNGSDGQGACGCDDEKRGEIFDEEVGKCRLKVGESCSSSNRRCVTNAFCGTGNKCQCYEGFSASPDKNCLLSFGEPCGISRIQGKRKKCNGPGGLICLSGKCDCMEGQEFNSSSLKCQDFKSKSISVSSNASEGLQSRIEYSNSQSQSNPAHLNEETSTSTFGAAASPVAKTGSNSLLIILLLSGSLVGAILTTFVGLTLTQKYGKFKLLRQCSTESHRVRVRTEDKYVIST